MEICLHQTSEEAASSQSVPPFGKSSTQGISRTISGTSHCEYPQRTYRLQTEIPNAQHDRIGDSLFGSFSPGFDLKISVLPIANDPSSNGAEQSREKLQKYRENCNLHIKILERIKETDPLYLYEDENFMKDVRLFDKLLQGPTQFE